MEADPVSLNIKGSKCKKEVILSLKDRPELIESFEKLGLSSNEARVYLALLENNPITGYQLSKGSGILRPVVYEMLNRLVEKGGARVIKSNPDTYVPVVIEEFLKNIEIGFTDAKSNISSTLKKFMVIDHSDYYWNIIGMKNIINSIHMMIQRAEKQIYISVQDQKLLNSFKDLLLTQTKKNVQVDIFSYYALDTGGLTLYSYRLDGNFQTLSILPLVVEMTIDSSESILSHFTDNKTSKAVYSKNIAQIKLIQNDILRSIYFIRLQNLYGTDKLKMLLNNEDKKLMENIENYLGS